MANINRRIKNFIEKASESVDSTEGNLVKHIENTILSNLTSEEKAEYEIFIHHFSSLREAIKSKIKEPTIAEKIKELKEAGIDRELTEEEQRVAKNVTIYLEREILIIQVCSSIINKQLKLQNIHVNFDKYVLSNFYRTLCELTTRLFTEILLLIIKYLIQESGNYQDKAISKEIHQLNNLMKRVLNYSIGLNDMKEILDRFDKRLDTGISISKLIENTFMYKQNEGFSLRNNIAHEKLLLSEIDNSIILKEILRVNNFNFAFIKSFYLELLSTVITKEQILKSKHYLNI